MPELVRYVEIAREQHAQPVAPLGETAYVAGVRLLKEWHQTRLDAAEDHVLELRRSRAAQRWRVAHGRR